MVNLHTFIRFFLILSVVFSTCGVQLSSAAEPVAQVQTTVNINTASAEQIAEVLNGIGLKRAEAIVEYRTRHGNFSSIEQLMDVKGIGEATLAKNKSRITF